MKEWTETIKDKVVLVLDTIVVVSISAVFLVAIVIGVLLTKIFDSVLGD